MVESLDKRNGKKMISIKIECHFMLIDLIVTYGFIIRNFVHSKDHLSSVTVTVTVTMCNHNTSNTFNIWFRAFVSLKTMYKCVRASSRAHFRHSPIIIYYN